MKMRIFFMCVTCQLVTCSSFRLKFAYMKNAPAKCFNSAFFLLFAAFSYSFGCQDSPVMDFGGFNSA